MENGEYDDLPQLSPSEERFMRLEFADWQAELGFDPADFSVDVGMGLVDGQRVGLMSALVIALSRHRITRPK